MFDTHIPERRRFLLNVMAVSVLVACGGKKYTKLASGSRVLALGDSLTAGYGAGKGEDYPSQLASITSWQIINGGVSGDTSAQALLRLPALLRVKPDLVIISIGGNDFLQRLPESETRINIGKIIEMVQAVKIPVVLVAIPHFTVGALLGKVSEHSLYDDLAAKYQLPLLKDVWAEVLSDKSMKSDQVHGNARGYRYFAEKMADFLKKQGFR